MTTSAVDVPFLDVTDPALDFGSDAVAQARAASWYGRTPLGLIVLRYAEVQEVLRDPRFAQSGKRYLALHGVTDGPLYDWFTDIILHRRGEDHLRLRRLVNQAFGPRAIEGFRPLIRERAEGLAASVAASVATEGECEFMDAFADLLPVQVLCAMLGIPAGDYEAFHRWSAEVGLTYSFALRDLRPRVEDAVTRLHEYVDTLIARRRAEPGRDLVSTLIAAEEAGDRLSSAELRNLLVALVFAGHDTTRNQLGQAMVTFAAHPDQWRLLGDRPELAPQAVEEVMRWNPSIPTSFRFALEDVDLHGTHIPEGTFLLLCAHSANRDPRVVANGGEFDITVRREVPHTTFGGGPHYCLGAATARAELAESLVALARRLGPPSIAGPVTWRPPTALAGPERLPLRFEPR
jgi:cytochrome P450